jgi:ATP-dependent DNA ligase
MGISFCPVKPIRGGKPHDTLYNQLASDPNYVCQAKLNGQRAVWEDGVLWSRSDRPITRAPLVLEALRGWDTALDGEFIPVKGEQDGIFWVFDLPDHKGTLVERWETLEALITDINSPHVRLCPTEVIWSQVDAEGWEGVVFKQRASKYQKAYVSGKTYAGWVKYRAEWL